MTTLAVSLDALGRAQLKFLQRLVAERPSTRPVAGIAGNLCTTRGIGQRGEIAGKLTYSHDDFVQAYRVIDELLGEAAPHARLEEPDASGSQAPVALHADAQASPRIAIHDFAATVPRGRPVDFSCTTLEEARHWDVQLLVVTQTVEQLRHASQMTWLRERLQGRDAIAVYQGGGRLLPKAAVATLLQETQAQIWAFCDFTPLALSWAASLPRLDAIAWPPREVLEKLVVQSPVARFVPMMQHEARRLVVDERALIRDAFVRMQTIGAGTLANYFPQAVV